MISDSNSLDIRNALSENTFCHFHCTLFLRNDYTLISIVIFLHVSFVKDELMPVRYKLATGDFVQPGLKLFQPITFSRSNHDDKNK